MWVIFYIYLILQDDKVNNVKYLKLNLYCIYNIEQTALATKYPVMVWIHGGGFKTGSSSERYLGPDLLLQKDVVLVTINYRLGAMGKWFNRGKVYLLNFKPIEAKLTKEPLSYFTKYSCKYSLKLISINNISSIQYNKIGHISKYVSMP